MTYHAKVFAGGKIVIPAALRRELGIAPGDSVVIESENGAIVIKTFVQVVREIQADVKARMASPVTVDAFLAERRAMWGED